MTRNQIENAEEDEKVIYHACDMLDADEMVNFLRQRKPKVTARLIAPVKDARAGAESGSCEAMRIETYPVLMQTKTEKGAIQKTLVSKAVWTITIIPEGSDELMLECLRTKKLTGPAPNAEVMTKVRIMYPPGAIKARKGGRWEAPMPEVNQPEQSLFNSHTKCTKNL